MLDEIGRLESDYVRSRYFHELFRAARLDSTSLSRTLALAGSVIGSDFELSQTLRAAAPAAALETVSVQAYVKAANNIHSDFERRRALVTLLLSGGSSGPHGLPARFFALESGARRSLFTKTRRARSSRRSNKGFVYLRVLRDFVMKRRGDSGRGGTLLRRLL